MNDDSLTDQLNQLEQTGLKRSLMNSEGKLNLSSNDYLGLSHHPRVIEAAQKAAQLYGVGAKSSRLLAGTLDCHSQLEHEVARFLKKDRALVYSSGYHANTGVLPVLAEAGDVIFVDRLCHASILDGVRLSKSRFFTFDHNNVDHLESLFRHKRQNYRRAFVVTEGVFSMDGDFPILQEIIYLAKKWEVHVYLDEAHSFGLFGTDGRGYADRLGLLEKIDVFIGTFSKAIGSQGGFVACSKTMAELLISKSRSFIYTTALSPVCVEAARVALQLFPVLSDRRENLIGSSLQTRGELRNLGYDTGRSQSQVIPILTGDISTTKNLSKYLFDAGFFVPSIRPPTVPQGEGRVRLSLTYDVVRNGLRHVMQAFTSYPQKPQKAGEKIVQTA